jgi:hypothetical protein
MDWLRAFRSLLGRMRTPDREAYLREHERERELGMQQIREMMSAGSAASDPAAESDSRKKE